MAFYLNHLTDGTKLPKFDKVDFLLQNVEGASQLKEVPTDFFAFIVNGKSELVAVVEMDMFDAACWIDIPRQLQICSAEDSRTVFWLRIPNAHKMIDYDKE
jgi:hypothetical protein